ncbi:MAG: hypothetical protein KAY61_03820, partial [Candidatus Eisenbacteria bacterium]|nr:hypothetical protein [Candidatus Eisenbacteria bacterium]
VMELANATNEPVIAGAARRTWAAFARQWDKPRLDVAEWALAVRASFADDTPPRSRWGVPEPKPASKPAVPAKKKTVKGKRR